MGTALVSTGIALRAVLDSKGIGEPPLLYAVGAYFAVCAAARAFRPDFTVDYKAPLTSEKLLLGLWA